MIQTLSWVFGLFVQNAKKATAEEFTHSCWTSRMLLVCLENIKWILLPVQRQLGYKRGKEKMAGNDVTVIVWDLPPTRWHKRHMVLRELCLWERLFWDGDGIKTSFTQKQKCLLIININIFILVVECLAMLRIALPVTFHFHTLDTVLC